MLKPLLWLALLLCSIQAFGQKAKVIQWNPGMERVYINGYSWYKAASGGAVVAVTGVDIGKYTLIAVEVLNQSDHNFDLLPTDSSVLSILGTKTRSLAYLSPEQVIRNIERSLAWRRFGAALAASNATRQQTAVSNTTGSVAVFGTGGVANGTLNTTTVTTQRVPDTEQQRLIWEAERLNEQRAAGEEQSIAAAALRATTILPGQQTRGAMFFPRDNGCANRLGCEILVTLAVDGTTFEFPMPLMGRQ
jgi:hypothetical protein